MPPLVWIFSWSCSNNSFAKAKDKKFYRVGEVHAIRNHIANGTCLTRSRPGGDDTAGASNRNRSIDDQAIPACGSGEFLSVAHCFAKAFLVAALEGSVHQYCIVTRTARIGAHEVYPSGSIGHMEFAFRLFYVVFGLSVVGV